MRNEISKLIKFAINNENIATWLEWKIFLIDFGITIEKIVTVLEWKLFLSAASKEAYRNHETSNQRVEARLHDAISFANAYYHVPEAGLSHELPPLPKSIPTFSDTDVLLSQPSTIHELSPLSESIPTFADTNVLYNVTVSGGGSYFLQQHANNLEMELTKIEIVWGLSSRIRV